MPKSTSPMLFWTIIAIVSASVIAETNKGSILQKEIRDYLQSEPISADLKSFIQRAKRNKLEKRIKRSQQQENDENNFFVLDHGNLVPFENLKTNFNVGKRDNADVDDGKGFTVVPLIIPIHPKKIQTRTLTEDLTKNIINVRDVSEKSTSSTTHNPSESDNEGGGEESKGESNDEDSQVLHKILEDVEGLMQWKSEGNKREGVICNINGSWISEAAGMRFDICYKNATRKKFRIHLADRIPPNDDGFFCDGNWTVFGELPFQHSGVVIVLAVHPKDKHIATFIGECRTCEGSETVSGAWLVSRSSRDCKDQKASAKVFSDVWRREQVHVLRKKHLLEMGYNEEVTPQSATG